MRRLAALLAVPVLLLTACGDDGGDGDDAASDADAAEEAEPVTPAEDDPLLDAVSVTGEIGEKPSVEVDGPVETDRTVRRIVEEGDGEPLADGMSVGVRSVLFNAEGEEIESAYDRLQAVTFDSQAFVRPIAEGIVEAPLNSRVVVATRVEEMMPSGASPGPDLEADDTVIMVFDLIAPEEVPVDADLGDDLPQVTLFDFGAPDIEVPDQDPPDDLVVEVLVPGDGREVPADGGVRANYTGFLWEDGSQFDSSWQRGQPVAFGLDQVVEGWSEGLAGQQVGSTVLLVVPPDLGYGSEGSPGGAPGQPGIPPDATLVFVVEIVEAMDEPPPPPGQPQGGGQAPGGAGGR